MEKYINILSVLQPWAFQAREFLRKKLIGKEVCFTVEIKTALGREYGMVYLGKGERTVTSKKSHKLVGTTRFSLLFSGVS